MKTGATIIWKEKWTAIVMKSIFGERKKRVESLLLTVRVGGRKENIWADHLREITCERLLNVLKAFKSLKRLLKENLKKN